MNRRDLLRLAGLVLGGGCLCHVARGAAAKSTCCSTPDLEPASLSFGHTTLTVNLAQAPSLAEVGDAAFLVNPERHLELTLVRAAPDRFVALSRNCTHGGQVVSYAWDRANSSLIVRVPDRQLTFVLLGNSEALSRKFDLGRDQDVTRSPFAREFLKAAGL